MNARVENSAVREKEGTHAKLDKQRGGDKGVNIFHAEKMKNYLTNNNDAPSCNDFSTTNLNDGDKFNTRHQCLQYVMLLNYVEEPYQRFFQMMILLSLHLSICMLMALAS